MAGTNRTDSRAETESIPDEELQERRKKVLDEEDNG